MSEQKPTVKKYTNHQESWRAEEIIVIILASLILIIALIIASFTEYHSEAYYNWEKVFTVLLVVFLLAAVWMECKNRKNGRKKMPDKKEIRKVWIWQPRQEADENIPFSGINLPMAEISTKVAAEELDTFAHERKLQRAADDTISYPNRHRIKGFEPNLDTMGRIRDLSHLLFKKR